MKFFVGVVAGAALGAAAAVIYAGRSGQDLRETYEVVKSDIDKRDFDALGSRLEARLAELQVAIEHRVGEAKAKAGAATEEARGAAEAGAAQAAEVADETAEAVEGAIDAVAKEAGDKA